MQTIRLFRADDIGNFDGGGVEPQTIVIEDLMPKTNTSISIYNQQADLLEQTLYKCLPGGTYDALLRMMLERRASMFRVPFGG